MKPFLAEDIRVILDKLDEFVDDKGTVGVGTKSNNPKDQKKDQGDKDSSQVATDPVDTADKKELPDYDKNVDDMLNKPAGLKKLVGSINVSTIANFLQLPERAKLHLRKALLSLKQDQPLQTEEQRKAIIQVLLGYQNKTPYLTSQDTPGPGMAEDLDDNKIKNYMARDQQKSSNSSGVDHTKNVISAVSKHGTPNEKKELGLMENMTSAQPVTIIGYQGSIENLADVATQGRKQEVMGIPVLGENGQPVLRFTGLNETKVYTANWDPSLGWVSDLS